ncbi:hypothetical protein ACOME3_007020 [Neoechinorhynchus agilis]
MGNFCIRPFDHYTRKTCIKGTTFSVQALFFMVIRLLLCCVFVIVLNFTNIIGYLREEARGSGNFLRGSKMKSELKIFKNPKLISLVDVPICAEVISPRSSPTTYIRDPIIVRILIVVWGLVVVLSILIAILCLFIRRRRRLSS